MIVFMLVGCTLISDMEITEKVGVGVGGGDSGATDTDVDPDTIDGDGDGYTGIDGDCDDSDYTVSPGANEDCTTTADDDCDGITNDPEAAGCSDFFMDSDGDGFGNEEPRKGNLNALAEGTPATVAPLAAPTQAPRR